jgi:hypothetical protein
MVDALGEARRVLKGRGILVDVRPVTAPIVVAVIVGAEAIWAKQVEVYSAPEDVAAADAAVQHALSSDWFAFGKSVRFDFEIFCDTAAELRLYVQDRKLRGEEIPYEDLDERRCIPATTGQTPRLRCRRPWMLSTYQKK